MFDSFVIVKKLNNQISDIVVKCDQVLTELLLELGLKQLSIEEISNKSIIFALGGDGTMLYCMREASRVGATSFGINFGHIGFLTDTSVSGLDLDKFRIFIRNHILHNSKISERLLLSNSMTNDVSCNELTISGVFSDSIIWYSLKIDDYNAGTHRANSILVSTPTGSTAYALSAGGGILMPELESLQVIPVAPLNMTSRPIITPGYSKIEIQAWGNCISIKSDGQTVFKAEEKYTKESPFSIVIQANKNKAKILHNKSWNFFNILSKKLGWIKH